MPDTQSPPAPTLPDRTPLPRLALWLGVAGLLPFLAAALLAWLDIERGVALAALAAYGASILSFLGAVHWGLALAGGAAAAGMRRPGEAAAMPARLVLGVLPSLVAWLALLLPLAVSLWVLGAAILLTAGVESLAAARGLVPLGYLRLRWGLSLGGAACLALGALVA